MGAGHNWFIPWWNASIQKCDYYLGGV